MTEVFLIDGVRTPIGKYGGALAHRRPDDLAAQVLGNVLERARVPTECVDEVIFGATNQAGEDNRNVARMALLLAGLPHSIPGYTVNRLCASGLTAIITAAQSIRCGDADVVVAGGTESMTRAPWVSAKPTKAWAGPGPTFDTAIGWRFTNPAFLDHDAATDEPITLSMGETAEEVAALHNITRTRSDTFALRSHARAVDAIDNGRFDDEIVPVPHGDKSVTQDENPRRALDLDTLAGLRTVFRTDGIVTAGSSSALADGAAAVVLASAEAVTRHGLVPKARIVANAAAGVAPHLMGLGPVPATHKALARAGWSTNDLDAVELNEAFAAQALAVLDELDLDPEIVNRNGGAIALGHPLGSSGARIVVTLLARMKQERARRAMASLCVGVGQGVSLLIEAA
ncbi:thiolase family protein [Rhodococcus sp. HM1]|uniref:thiolase family protein n=1 Tax=unclassified Rhodococcus (in: high G+C Gram-positive bacteria) TaxID=192944 RepID=UPI0018CEA4FC|nr:MULTISPECIES: thiolase family protein [unclassified Rhodococcus (in: high G+C Gram-positive bacteria)]MBH0121261.1 thiolase family protein [Rhodococcus sp. CX]MCK8671274.1 thiolase family protein [Rhodococcus sp. HM1]